MLSDAPGQRPREAGRTPRTAAAQPRLPPPAFTPTRPTHRGGRAAPKETEEKGWAQARPMGTPLRPQRSTKQPLAGEPALAAIALGH